MQKTIADFHAEHRQIVALANRLMAMIDPLNPPDRDALSAARWDIVVALDAHLAGEETVVQQELGHSEDHIVTTMARRYSSELLDLRLSLAMHRGTWTAESVPTDWEGYRAAVHEQLAIVVKRIAWEERVIFPLIERARAARGMAPAA